MGQRDHWTKKLLDTDALHALRDGLSSSQLWSLLHEVLAGRAEKRSLAELRRQFERDGFVQPSEVSPTAMLEVDRLLFAAASAFEPVELSPVAPLGVCSAIASTGQRRIVSALRGTEVVSDPTNVMALECARRLKDAPESYPKLATSHRCVRGQPLPDEPGFSRHFRLFALAAAGRERADHGFSVAAIGEQIRVHLEGIARLRDAGHPLGPPKLRLLTTPSRRALGERVAEDLAADGLPISSDVLDHDYYDGFRFQIDVGDPESELPLADGGCFDWLAKLGNDRRLVFVASAIGSQLIAQLFPDRMNSR